MDGREKYALDEMSASARPSLWLFCYHPAHDTETLWTETRISMCFIEIPHAEFLIVELKSITVVMPFLAVVRYFLEVTTKKSA